MTHARKGKSVRHRFRMAQLLVLPLMLLATAWAEEKTLDPKALDDFQPLRMVYGASVLFISLNSEVRQEKISASTAAEELMDVENSDPLAPANDVVLRQTIITDILGRHTEHTSWLDPDTRILQRTSLNTGRKQRYRNYRYMEDEVYSIKRHPANESESEHERDWKQWTRIVEDRYPLSEANRERTLSEASAIFYLLAAAGLEKKGDETRLALFDPDGVILVALRVEEETRLSVNFDLKPKTGETREIDERIDVLRIHLHVAPADKGGKTENFNFMGYKDDIDLYFDPKRKLLVQASGKVDYLGKVDIRLKEAEYL